MKKFALAVSAFVAVLITYTAHAEGEVVCLVTTSSTATDTQKLHTDGGTDCSWGAGAAIALQCPNAKVCYDPAVRARLPDGGPQVTADGGLVPGPAADLNDLCANFLNSNGNPDPYMIYLNPDQQNIGLIAAEIGDGGTSVDCKLAKTRRRSPSN